jgi:fructose-1,6-bisphosphatase/inositol monophosphatase family enzyme
MMSSFLEQLGSMLRDVALTEIAPRFRQLAPTDVIGKPSADDPHDIVTLADRAAEAALTARLPELWPGSVVVGEEAVAADPLILERISGKAPVWLVDPLDGTRNFAAGRTPFGTMVALVESGTLLASGIYLTEGDQAFLAERGAGTYLNGVRIRSERRAAEPLAGTAYTRFMREEEALELERRTLQHTRIPGETCAAHEYGEVVQSRKDYVVYYRLFPWDHAPGALLVSEAGGVARHPQGSDYSVFERFGPILVSPTPAIWERSRRELF